jgi:hypothetical protein
MFNKQEFTSIKKSQAKYRVILSLEVPHFFKDRIISKKLWPPRSPDLAPADFFLWGLLKNKVYKNTPRTIEQLKYAIGHSIPDFGETHSSVPGCEMRPFSASIMSRSCFASFPVCVYKVSNHCLNKIIVIGNILGPLARESPFRLKTNAAIWFNNIRRTKHPTPNYIHIKVSGKYPQSKGVILILISNTHKCIC